MTYNYDEETDLELIIQQDPDPESPREWDNHGRMLCLHGRYNLGDKHDFRTSGDIIKIAFSSDNIAEPLYLMDHSGLAMSTEPFSCPWDSGQVGYIVAPRSLLKELEVDEETLREWLKQEVATYSQYLEGDVWCYVVRRRSSGEVVDSLCGMFGWEYAEAEGLEGFNYQKKAHVEKLIQAFT